MSDLPRPVTGRRDAKELKQLLRKKEFHLAVDNSVKEINRVFFNIQREIIEAEGSKVVPRDFTQSTPSPSRGTRIFVLAAGVDGQADIDENGTGGIAEIRIDEA